MRYKLYWNNVCLITKMEERYIEQKIQAHNLPLDPSYFGLGRACSLLHKVQEEIENGGVNADIVLSTDTDVVQDVNMLPSCSDFAQIADDFPMHENLTFFTSPCKRFVPFIIIPLIGVYNKKLITKNELPASYESFIMPRYAGQYAFGGLHNSAGRSLLKAIWYQYGENFAHMFMKYAQPKVMPAAAYNAVASGNAAFAVVPTIFAGRAVGNDLGTFIPSEGIVPIPSYIAIKRNVNISQIKQYLLNKELQDMLVSSASVIGTAAQQENTPVKEDFFTTPWEFIQDLNHDKFRMTLLSYAK